MRFFVEVAPHAFPDCHHLRIVRDGSQGGPGDAVVLDAKGIRAGSLPAASASARRAGEMIIFCAFLALLIRVEVAVARDHRLQTSQRPIPQPKI